jgi:hypothetical protein
VITVYRCIVIDRYMNVYLNFLLYILQTLDSEYYSRAIYRGKEPKPNRAVGKEYSVKRVYYNATY